MITKAFEGEGAASRVRSTGVLLAGIASAMLFTGWFGALLLLRGARPGDWGRLPPGTTGWLVAATLALVLSSVCVDRAVRLRERGRSVPFVLAGLALVLCFAALQCVAWWRMREAGVPLLGTVPRSAFVLLAAGHGLHLAATSAWGLCTIRRPSGNLAAFWHFLGAVWIAVLAFFLF